MNNIKYLREKHNLSLRALAKNIGLSNTILSLLENEKRMFREVHINSLCNFFQVSADFLLGKSDFGIFIELSSGAYACIDKEIYEKYKNEDVIKETIVANQIIRRATKPIELRPSSDVFERLVNELKELTEAELEKVLKFVKDFIK